MVVQICNPSTLETRGRKMGELQAQLGPHQETLSQRKGAGRGEGEERRERDRQ
jgi:hypothetical protein